MMASLILLACFVALASCAEKCPLSCSPPAGCDGNVKGCNAYEYRGKATFITMATRLRGQLFLPTNVRRVFGEGLKCDQIKSEGEVIVNGHDCRSQSTTTGTLTSTTRTTAQHLITTTTRAYPTATTAETMNITISPTTAATTTTDTATTYPTATTAETMNITISPTTAATTTTDTATTYPTTTTAETMNITISPTTAATTTTDTATTYPTTTTAETMNITISPTTAATTTTYPTSTTAETMNITISPTTVAKTTTDTATAKQGTNGKTMRSSDQATDGMETGYVITMASSVVEAVVIVCICIILFIYRIRRQARQRQLTPETVIETGLQSFFDAHTTARQLLSSTPASPPPPGHNRSISLPELSFTPIAKRTRAQSTHYI